MGELVNRAASYVTYLTPVAHGNLPQIVKRNENGCVNRVDKRHLGDVNMLSANHETVINRIKTFSRVQTRASGSVDRN